jgi:asparagine synthase (glutamine-hydrolysing)
MLLLTWWLGLHRFSEAALTTISVSKSPLGGRRDLWPFVAISRGEDGALKISGTPLWTMGSADREPIGQVSARWSISDGELVAEVDWSGMANLFYYATPDRVMVSTSPLVLIAEGAPGEWDSGALAVFRYLGYFIEETTPFRAMKVLPPGGRLTWRDGRLQVSGGRPVWTAEPVSHAAAIEEFQRKMRDSIRACIEAAKGEIVVPLSGGRDSRHILLEMHAQNRLPSRCVTVNRAAHRLDHEARAAAEIAAATGVEHVLIPPPPGLFAAGLQTLVVTHLCSDEIAELTALRRYAIRHPSTYFDGIAGDILTRNKAFTNETCHKLSTSGAFSELAEQLCESIAKIIGRPCDKSSSDYKEAVQRIAETLSRHASAPDPYTSFLFWNRTRREIALSPHRQLMTAREVFCPYLDPHLAQFLGSLPFAVTSSGHFHDDAIEAHYPLASTVSYADKPSAADYQRPLMNKVAAGVSVAAATMFQLRYGAWIRPVLLHYRQGKKRRLGAVAMAQHMAEQFFGEPMTPKLARSLIGYVDSEDSAS